MSSKGWPYPMLCNGWSCPMQWKISARVDQMVFRASTNEIIILKGWVESGTIDDCWEESRAIVMLDADTGAVVRTAALPLSAACLATSSRKIAVSDERGLLYGIRGHNYVDVVRLADTTFVRRMVLQTFVTAMGLAVDERRDLLFVYLFTQHAVLVSSATDGRHIHLVSLPPPEDGSVTSDGDTSIVPSTGELFVAVVAAAKVYLFVYDHVNAPGRVRQLRHISLGPHLAPGVPTIVATDDGIVYVANTAALNVTIWMVRASDGRPLDHPTRISSATFCVTPSSLVMCDYWRSAATALRLPARQSWQPDACVHARFIEGDADTEEGSGGDDATRFRNAVAAVLGMNGGKRTPTSSSGFARLSLELLCVVLAHAAPIVLKEPLV